MLPRKNRLSKQNDFRLIFKQGERCQTPYFSIYRLKRSGLSSRFAVVVSTAISKRAVKRNRLRRRVYEIIKQETKRMPGGADIIFIAKKQAISATAKELDGAVREFFK